jgi:hypothetical protein
LLAAVTWGCLGLSSGASLGCVGAQVAAIEAASEAQAALYQAERDWVGATIELADVLTAIALGDIDLPEETKKTLRAAAGTGRAAVLRAQAALALDATGGEPFQRALAELHAATTGVQDEIRGLVLWIP